MAEVFKLNDPADRQRLVEKMSAPVTNGEGKKKRGRPPKLPYVERKLSDARSRGLFETKIDFRHLRHRIVVTEAATAGQFFLTDPITSQTKYFPDSKIHYEYFLNAHIIRSPILILSEIEDFVLTNLTSGLTRLPRGKEVEVSLLLSSEFRNLDEALDFFIEIGKKAEPRIRQAKKLLAAASDEILRTLLNGDDHAIETALYLYEHKITHDPHELWRVLSGELIIASYARCRLPPQHAMYVLMPQQVYTDAARDQQVIEVYDFDLVTDPIQTW